MPANDRHSSFSHLTEDEFRVYATDLLEAYHTSAKRQRLQSYLQQVVAQDKAAADAEQSTLNVKRQRRRKHQEVIEELAVSHAHDYERHSELFQETTITDADILVMLTNNDSEIYIRDRDITGTVVLSGNNVKLAGLGTTGTAVGGDLAHTCIVTGQIQISGTDVTLEGIHFKFAAGAGGSAAIVFSGGTNTSLTLKNCTFEGTGTYADAIWFRGAGSGGGTQHIENCRVLNYGSWMSFDATTGSGAATVRIESFTLTKCKFENVAGSGAVRGMQDNPNGSAIFTDNLFAFGEGGRHASFWDIVEAHNTLRVVCTGNTVTGGEYTDDSGFLQCWSRSAVPWVITYSGNTIENFGAAVRIACNATFYCPNTFDPDFALKATAAETTNVTNGASFVYPYTDSDQVYAPENEATFPEPAGEFEGLDNFAHA